MDRETVRIAKEEDLNTATTSENELSIPSDLAKLAEGVSGTSRSFHIEAYRAHTTSRGVAVQLITPSAGIEVFDPPLQQNLFFRLSIPAARQLATTLLVMAEQSEKLTTSTERQD